MRGRQRLGHNNRHPATALVMASTGVRMYHSQWLQFKE